MNNADKAKLKTASKNLAKLSAKKSSLLTERELALVELIVTFLASLALAASGRKASTPNNGRPRPAAARAARRLNAPSSERD